MIANSSNRNLACPFCKGSHAQRYGFRKGVQVYKCMPCNKKFTANGALPGRRIPTAHVGEVLSMFYDGLSYNDIQRNIQQRYGYKPSTATLYELVVRYSNLGRKATKDFKARTGHTWVADETVIRTDDGKLWLFNIMDSDTRFLLATHVSRVRTIRDVETVFKKAKARAKTAPEIIITDGMPAYPEGIERVFGGDARHLVSQGLKAKLNNNLSERMQGTIKERTKVMRGLGDTRAARLYLDGFTLHYNYFKPHMGLQGRTPAQAADLPQLFEHWGDVAELREVDIETIQKDRTLKRRPKVSRPFRVRRAV